MSKQNSSESIGPVSLVLLLLCLLENFPTYPNTTYNSLAIVLSEAGFFNTPGSDDFIDQNWIGT